ncbi:MAG: IMS domain-containing protein [Synechococcales bacterium]|nr:IMS domain-containing protein [Synechococcales bacterium]
MQIPLDYYRILGLPIQATDEQLRHAHRDRTLQLPRREYSEVAIAVRRQLIDEAYEILSDSTQRQAYDANFLARSYETIQAQDEAPSADRPTDEFSSFATADVADSYTPRIEVRDDQLVGALLILLELGEYELVLRLGRPYLSSGNVSLESGRFGAPDIVGADIVLTIALACLELGREQWQQGQYENAAESLETGQELLLREGLFASVRGEMQADLFKLRPYRILELLALPEANEAERYKGLRLLQDMLHERGGIDGSGNDQSGLGTDDFLRFIQQLRSYLTVAEQQSLFETEARRPSAVATYLAVYALIAGGFAYRQPALVRRAQLLLVRLSVRQDVSLEQSICALLLGQTAEASQFLEQSSEQDALAYIQEHSRGAPDLLPGLCLYAEQWLQGEVFPHFRDLAEETTSLKDYFADAEVQSYLENMPHEAEHTGDWEVATPVGYGRSQSRFGNGAATPDGDRYARIGAATATVGNSAYGNGQASTPMATLPVAERVSQLSPEGRLSQRELDSSNGGSPPRNWRSRSTDTIPKTELKTPAGTVLSRRGVGKGQPPRLDRLLFLAAMGVIGIIILWILASWVYGLLSQRSQTSALQGEQLQISLNQPVVTIPDPNEPPPALSSAEGELTEAGAIEVIRAWLAAKSAAMGENHNAEALSEILVGSLLDKWQGQSTSAQAGGWYLEYEHPNLTVESVEWEEETPDQATIYATVTEVGNFYKNGQLDLSQSYDSEVQVSYDLVRDENGWKVQSIDLR